MDDNVKHDALQKAGAAIRIDPLNPGANIIDLAQLSDDQQQQLLMEYRRGTLDVGKQAAQMQVDVAAFKSMLDVMASKTKELSEHEGTSVTMQHTHESSVGKTEVIMGNTEQAAKGRLTRSMAGERNVTLLYVVIGVIAALILVSIFVRH